MTPKTRFSLRTVSAVSMILALACSCGPGPGGRGDSMETAGLTQNEVLLGSSCAVTGHAGYLGTNYLHGAMAFFNALNARGGIEGRTVRVISYDDQYEPSRCVLNTQRLINQDKVFCLFNYVGTPTSDKIIPIVEEARIPLVGILSGADVLRHPVKEYIFNLRSSYYQEAGRAVVHFVEDLGFKKIAVFYQNDAYGLDGLKGTEIALKQYGLGVAAAESYERGTLEVGHAAEIIGQSGAEAVIMVGLYGPCSQFVKQLKDKDFKAVFYSVSFVGADEFAAELGERYSEGVIVSQVVPPINLDVLSSVREYKKLAAFYYPKEKPNTIALEGFLNAKVLAEGLRRAGKDLTRKKFIRALETLKEHSLGIGNPIDYGPDNHQGLQYVFFTRIEKGKFIFFSDWHEIENGKK